MRDDYSRSRADGVAGDLALLLSLYLAVAGGFAFGLYELLQPTRFTNPGLAAYKSAPATSVTPRRALNLTSPPSADLSEPVIISTTPEPKPDTDGQSTARDPLNKTLIPAHRPPKNTKSAKAYNRQIRREVIGNQERVAFCLPRYDSSGAQTHAC